MQCTPHIKGPDGRLCGAKLAPVAWLAFELVCSFQAAPLEAGQSDCSRLFTSAEAFRVPAEARNSCVLSCFDRGSLRPFQSKVGWAGRKRREINDRTRHQSVAPGRSHVTQPSHMWVHCTLLIHAFTPYMHSLVNHTHTPTPTRVHVFMNIPRWNEIKCVALVKLQLGHKENCVLPFASSCSGNDQHRTNKMLLSVVQCTNLLLFIDAPYFCEVYFFPWIWYWWKIVIKWSVTFLVCTTGKNSLTIISKTLFLIHIRLSKGNK